MACTGFTGPLFIGTTFCQIVPSFTINSLSSSPPSPVHRDLPGTAKAALCLVDRSTLERSLMPVLDTDPSRGRQDHAGTWLSITTKLAVSNKLIFLWDLLSHTSGSMPSHSFDIMVYPAVYNLCSYFPSSSSISMCIIVSQATLKP